MRTAEGNNQPCCCSVDFLSLPTVVQTESPGRKPMLWTVVLACRQLYGKVPGIQATDLSLLPTTSTNRAQPRDGRNSLTPKIQTNRSLWSSNKQPQAALYQGLNSPFLSVSLSYLMFLCRERHFLTDLGKCRWPGIIFALSLTPFSALTCYGQGSVLLLLGITTSRIVATGLSQRRKEILQVICHWDLSFPKTNHGVLQHKPSLETLLRRQLWMGTSLCIPL